MVLSLIPQGIFAAVPDDNDWQIASGLYTGNAATNKTVSADGKVRIQKNVKPTGVENEFLVYIAVDALVEKIVTSSQITTMLEIDPTMMYIGGPGNKYGDKDPSEDPDWPGNGSYCSGTGSTTHQLPFDENGDKYKFMIYHDGVLIADPVLQLAVPNSSIFLKVGDKFICLENIKHGTQTPFGDLEYDSVNGYYIVPVYLSEASYGALFETYISTIEGEETSVIIVGDGEDPVTITDPMGAYIVYDGVDENFSSDVSSPAAAAAAPGTTVTWTLDPKTNPEETEHITHDPEVTTIPQPDGGSITTTVVKTTWWDLNVAEIQYKVHLDVTKDGFASGTVYPVNDGTKLNYKVDGSEVSAEFTEPEVKGTLYNISFKKVDGSGNAISGVTFTLSGPSGNPDVTAYSPDKTATSASDGTVSFVGIPWGTYTLTETVPAGYTGVAPMTLNIGYTSWPDDVTHNETANDLYKLNADGIVVNTLNTVTVNKSVAVFGDLTAAEVEHTIYYALRNKDGNVYLTDENGLVYKTVTITAGVPSPASVTFEGVPSGEYDVMELSSIDPITELEIGDVVHESNGTDIKVYGISAKETDGSSGNDANLINGVSSATVYFTNTYAHADVPVEFVANKKWASYSGADIAAPGSTSVTFTLYRIAEQDPAGSLEEVMSFTLDGEVDARPTGEDPAAYESAAWTVSFINLPNQNTNSYAYTYKVNEVVPAGYAAYLGNTPMGADDYLTQNGGSITNRKQSTSVMIQKIVSGLNTQNQAFEFTAELPQGTNFAAGQPEGVTVNGNTATFSLKNNGQVTLVDVPVGAVLTVTETTVSNFAASVVCGDDAVDGNVYEYTVAEPGNSIIFTNTREIGNLTVSKTVVSDLAADKTVDYEFTVTLDDAAVSGTFGGASFTDGVATFTLKHGQSVSITGLPAGVGYTVEETPVENFETTSEGESGTISTTASAAAFTNTRKTGDLTISKTVVSPLEADQDLEFPFLVFFTGAGSTLAGTYDLEVTPAGTDASSDISINNGVAAITLKGGQSATIKGLPAGIGFEVYESEYEGFTPAPVNSEGYPFAEGTITTDGAAVEFTNTALPGTITVTKTFDGITEAIVPSDFAIKIGDKTLKIADADAGSKFPTYTWTLADMPAGSYTATESGADVDGYTVTVSGDNGVAKDLEKAGETAFEITNKYELDTATLKLKKVADGATVPDGAKFVISGTPTAKDQTFEDKTVTYADIKDGSYSITVPTGTYKVTESGAEVAGYTLETEYSDDVTLEKDGEGTLTVTNTYTKIVVSINVTKVWDDGDDSEGTRPDSVKIVLLANDKATDKVLTLSADTEWKGTFDDLDKVDADGKEIAYSVKEEEPEGYTAKITGSAEEGFVVTNTAKTPDTGDHSDIALWTSTMCISLFCMAVLIIKRRRGGKHYSR